MRIIISGSSSLDINRNAGEPLTSRKYSFNLYALSEREFNQIENTISKRTKFEKDLFWENYMISERVKYQGYKRVLSNNYFWRIYHQQEIGWVEEREGLLFGYEFKWKEEISNLFIMNILFATINRMKKYEIAF